MFKFYFSEKDQSRMGRKTEKRTRGRRREKEKEGKTGDYRITASILYPVSHYVKLLTHPCTYTAMFFD